MSKKILISILIILVFIDPFSIFADSQCGSWTTETKTVGSTFTCAKDECEVYAYIGTNASMLLNQKFLGFNSSGYYTWFPIASGYYIAQRGYYFTYATPDGEGGYYFDSPTYDSWTNTMFSTAPEGYKISNGEIITVQTLVTWYVRWRECYKPTLTYFKDDEGNAFYLNNVVDPASLILIFFCILFVMFQIFKFLWDYFFQHWKRKQ